MKNQPAAQQEEEGTVQTAKPMRYADPNYTIPGVPARDLSAEEAARFAARIQEVQTNCNLVIYEEVS